MSHTTDDPDAFVQQEIDFNHMNPTGSRMEVPDSITLGPNRSTVPRFGQNYERLPVHMVVPDSIRLDGHVNTKMVNGNHVSQSTTQQPAFHSSDNELSSDEEYTTINTPKNPQQPIKIADSWHIEPFTDIDDKNVLNKLQLLQNRIHHIERTLARQDFRNRFVYSCVVGYFLLQVLLSVRRSMLN